MQEDRLGMLLDLAQKKVGNVIQGEVAKRLLIYRYPNGHWIVREVEAGSVTPPNASGDPETLEKALEDFLIKR